MRWNLISSLSKIQLYYSWCVDGVSLVRINNDTEKARIGVDKFGLESNVQIVEDRRIIKIGQICHVFNLFELPWVDLADFGGFENFFLMTTRYSCFVSVNTFKQALHVSMFAIWAVI